MNRKVIYFLLLLSYLAVIFYLSSLPPKVKVGSFDFPIHVLEFLPLGVLSFLFFKEMGFKRPFLFSFIFSFLYAISDEIHQMFVPGRNASLKDVLADWVGIILGLYVFRKWQK